MRVRRESTSWVTSLMILAFSLGERVVNHLARRCEENFAVSPSEVPPACGKKIGVGHETNHFALSGQENQVAGLECQSVYKYQQTHLMMVESH